MIEETRKLRHRIANRYQSPWLIGYARGKMRTDPVYREVFRLIGASTAPLLDVGCGMGIHAFYLRERGYTPPVTGLDVDKDKVERAQRIAARHYPDMVFETRDCRDLPPFSGHVSMLDVLHYLEPAEQSRVLRDMAARVAPGCYCFIRVTPNDGSWRFRCTLAIEQLAKSLAWMTQDAVVFPKLEDIAAQFPESEFTHDIKPLWGRTPFNSWSLTFQRRSLDAPGPA